jgi:dolichyl-phosphate-mannose--protein O-mannosyl transferase
VLLYSFGGFASKYIKGKFFMDVHPPLAKLLITLAGWLAGFDGDFDFKDIGKDYLEPGVPYVAMRLLPAILGVLTIPTIFLTLKASGARTTTAALGAGLLIFGMLSSRKSKEDNRLTVFRKRPRHPVTAYPPRLAPRHLHRPHSFVLDRFHKSA